MSNTRQIYEVLFFNGTLLIVSEIIRPKYTRIKLIDGRELATMREQLRGVPTVCAEAKCPNLSECWRKRTATFMLLGDVCTRNCGFCGVQHGKPVPIDIDEPRKIAESVKQLSLRHCVLTSVTRDDLSDGGAQHYANVLEAIRELNPNTTIEVLIPDFRYSIEHSWHIIADVKPDVINHNLETVPRLYSRVRPQADYQTSLELLQWFSLNCNYKVRTKSGLMVGLGEEWDELEAVFHEMRKHYVDILTVGQYLRPTQDQLPVEKYWYPEEFERLARIAIDCGFKVVAVGPLVRSSYFAEVVLDSSNTGVLQNPRAGEFVYIG